MSTRRGSRRSGPADPVTAWAREVAAGKRVAGQLTRHAAERHLQDLKDGPKRGLHWDLEAALHVIRWYPTMLSITAGERSGQPFELLPHHLFATGSLFGWKRDNGRRRFRRFWQETGKGQAKSPWMAATGLYLMRFGGVPRFEGYAVAGNENQSGIVLGDAAAMCRAFVPGEETTLEEFAELTLRGTGDLTWQIEWDGSDYGLGICKLRNVASGKSISGPKPSLVMGDEIHEWDDPNILELWTSALNKMPGDPLLLLGTNTPAADQIVGTEQSDYYAAVAKGDVRDDASLALICSCDEGDDPLEDESVWPKALPALDITYPAENLRDEVEAAQHLPGKRLTLKRLFFGLRVGIASCWIDLDLWKSTLAPAPFDEAELRTLPCWLGLDLSSRKDLTALALIWRRPNGELLARVWYWTPKDTIKARSMEDRAPYDQWADLGFLTAVPGPTIPKAWPAARVKQALDGYDVRGLAYDPAQILDFEEALDDAGVEHWRYEGPEEKPGKGLMMVRHGQGFKGMDNPALLNMPTSVKAFEEQILNGRMTIETNPVTTFCSSNMALQPGANPDQRVPTRRKSRGRIDGMIALIEATGAWEFDPRSKRGPSIYETRGITTI